MATGNYSCEDCGHTCPDGECSKCSDPMTEFDRLCVNCDAQRQDRVFEWCGGCDHYHRADFGGDCRDDAERYTLDEIPDGAQIIDQDEMMEREGDSPAPAPGRSESE